MKNNLARNIPLLYITRALHLPFFWLPILYYYLTQVKGFSVIDTTFLMGLQEFSRIFLELPTGVIADKISRKFSIMLGYIITSIPFMFLPFTNSLAAVALIFMVKSVGKALVSGADSALLYDTLIDLDRVDEYKKIKTESGVWMMGVATIAMFVGGWLGERGYFGLTFTLPLILQLVAALAAYLMIEPDTSRRAKEMQDNNYLTHTWNSIKIVTKSSWILVLAIAFSILEGTAINMKWYYPAIFENLGYGLLATGVLMATLYGGKTLINAIGTKLIFKEAILNTVIWVAIIALGWGGLSLTSYVVGIVAFLVLIILGLELAINSTEELIHQSLESRVRATAMSFISLLSSVGATALLWGWGLTLQLANIETAIGIQGLIFGVVGIIFLAYYKKRQTVAI